MKLINSYHSKLLTTLKIQNSKIENFFNYFSTPNVFYLNLTDNQIKNFYNISSLYFVLQILDLSYNPLEILPNFANLPILSKLYLSFTKISALKYKSFHILKKLKYFELIGCDIKSIDSNIFNENYIEYFNLSSTKLPKNQLKNLIKNLLNIKMFKSQYFRACCFLTISAKSMKNCYPMYSVLSTCDQLLASLWLTLTIWFVGLIGLILNILSIKFHLKSERKICNLFYILMSISDGLTNVYLLIIASVNSYYRGNFFENEELWISSYLCKFTGSLMNFSIIFSTKCLLLISFQKYLAIKYPFKKFFPEKSVIIFSMTCFSSSLLLGSFPLIFYEVRI